MANTLFKTQKQRLLNPPLIPPDQTNLPVLWLAVWCSWTSLHWKKEPPLSFWLFVFEWNTVTSKSLVDCYTLWPGWGDNITEELLQYLFIYFFKQSSLAADSLSTTWVWVPLFTVLKGLFIIPHSYFMGPWFVHSFSSALRLLLIWRCFFCLQTGQYGLPAKTHLSLRPEKMLPCRSLVCFSLAIINVLEASHLKPSRWICGVKEAALNKQLCHE